MDRLFYRSDDMAMLKEFLTSVEPADGVADVGGGKKPAKKFFPTRLGGHALYDGYDMDLDELRQAKHEYSEIYWIDLVKPDFESSKQYEKVICVSTLEHVTDTRVAIQNLAKMLKPGGKLYIKVPCKLALFAQLNLLLPGDLKKRLLHFVFPHKRGDGFPAYYNDCLPSKFMESALLSGLQVEADKLNKTYYSTYFTFFFPFYIIWRAATLAQILLFKDYCESFEIVLCKPVEKPF